MKVHDAEGLRDALQGIQTEDGVEPPKAVDALQKAKDEISTMVEFGFHDEAAAHVEDASEGRGESFKAELARHAVAEFKKVPELRERVEAHERAAKQSKYRNILILGIGFAFVLGLNADDALQKKGEFNWALWGSLTVGGIWGGWALLLYVIRSVSRAIGQGLRGG